MIQNICHKVQFLLVFLSLTLLLPSQTVFAQYYLVGQDPASTKWEQINTEHFQVIFPESFEKKAHEVAQMLELSVAKIGATYNHEIHKISLILHNQTVQSNGFVSWAPSRMEFYTTPDQDTYGQDWLEQLCMHELRHVVQMDKVESEMPKILKIIFGEQAAPAITGLYLPFWFLEGDAVRAETAYGNVGRGRVPSFGMQLKAQLVEQGAYSYDKAYLGSYKDFVPNHYIMGYHFVAGVQKEYGADVWKNVVSHVANRPFSGRALTRGLKKWTGFNKVPLYDKVFRNFREQWREEIANASIIPLKKLTAEPEIFTQYRYPSRLENGDLLALKTSYNAIPAFVRINEEKEESIVYQPGNWSSESVSQRDDILLWVEAMNDVRWEFREESRIYVLDVNTKELIKIDLPQKLFAPCLSPDHKQIVCVNVTDRYGFELVFIDIKQQKIVRSVAMPKNTFPQTPFWSENEEIFFVTTFDNGKSIKKMEIESGEFTTVVEAQYNELRRPFVEGDFLYYTSSEYGKDDVWMCNLRTNKRSCIAQSTFGFRDVFVHNNFLLLADYSSMGYSLGEVNLHDTQVTAPPKYEMRYPLAEIVSEQELGPGVIDFSLVDSTKTYNVTKYSKLGHLLRFHSWAPISLNIDDESIKPGITLFTQNDLSTLSGQLGYEYDLSDEVGRWYTNLTYYGWYPVIDLEFDTQNFKSNYYTISNQDTVLSSTTIRNTGSQLSVSLPLNFSVGKWYRNFTPKIEADWNRYTHAEDTPEDYFEGDIFSLDAQLTISNFRQSAYRDVQSQWGQIFNVEYIKSIGGDLDYGDAFGVEGYVYTPGLFAHHGLRLYGGYQEKSGADRWWGDIINRSTGIGSFSNSSMITLSGRYSLPLCYPDWSLGGLVYFQRLTASIFYDYSKMDALLLSEQNTVVTSPLSVSSYGGELRTDCNFVRFKAPAQLGIRVFYLPDYSQVQTEMIFSLNFSAL